LLVRIHGFRRWMLVELVRSGLAAIEHEEMVAGGKMIEVAQIHITAAGRKAIEG
jgi:hypothetical protein